MEAARLALQKKAVDVQVLDMRELVSYTDYFVICSGENTQQVRAMVDNVHEGLGKFGQHAMGLEGRSHSHWVLLDYSDVIVHAFLAETREYYQLERLWLDAPRLDIEAVAGA